jgi:hypothetical protein
LSSSRARKPAPAAEGVTALEFFLAILHPRPSNRAVDAGVPGGWPRRKQVLAFNSQVLLPHLLRDDVKAMAALDWSNGALKLPDYTTIATPVAGNIAFNYSNQTLQVYSGSEWRGLSRPAGARLPGLFAEQQHSTLPV